MAKTQAELEAMTVADLKAYAAEEEIDLQGATVKADIVNAIQRAEGDADGDDESDGGTGDEPVVGETATGAPIIDDLEDTSNPPDKHTARADVVDPNPGDAPPGGNEPGDTSESYPGDVDEFSNPQGLPVDADDAALIAKREVYDMNQDGVINKEDVIGDPDVVNAGGRGALNVDTVDEEPDTDPAAPALSGKGQFDHLVNKLGNPDRPPIYLDSSGDVEAQADNEANKDEVEAKSEEAAEETPDASELTR